MRSWWRGSFRTNATIVEAARFYDRVASVYLDDDGASPAPRCGREQLARLLSLTVASNGFYRRERHPHCGVAHKRSAPRQSHGVSRNLLLDFCVVAFAGRLRTKC